MSMDPLLRVSSYEPVEKLLDGLIDRFAKAKLDVSRSRISRYRNSIVAVREKAPQGVWPKDSALHDEQLWNDVHETYCLWEACKGFPDLAETGLQDRLEKVVSGPANLADERKTDARDTLFELIMASWLRLGGFQVALRSTEDVYFEIQGIPCVMECKRIQSVERLEERVDKASDQLHQQLRTRGNAALRGFIAVDISKPLIKPEGALRGKDMEEVGQSLKNCLYEFYVQNMRHLISPTHERIVVVFLFAGAVGVFPDNGFGCLFGGLCVGLNKEYGKNCRIGYHFRDAINNSR
jgi:hypothetical protein